MYYCLAIIAIFIDIQTPLEAKQTTEAENDSED